MIAEIYIASHGIERRRKKPDYGYGTEKEPAPNLAFQDVKSDFTTHELTQFAEGVKVRWPDIVSTKESDRCREILVDLVEANIEWLTEMLEEHEQHKAHTAERVVRKLGFEQSYEGELMRRYELRYGSALDRTIKTYEKVRGMDGRGNDEPPRRPFDFRTAKRGSGPAGKPDGRDMESAMVAWRMTPRHPGRSRTRSGRAKSVPRTCVRAAGFCRSG